MPHTNQEKAKVLSQPVLKVKDIRILLDCGSKRATDNARQFREWFKQQNGYETYQIPTEEWITCNSYNEKRVLHYASLGY